MIGRERQRKLSTLVGGKFTGVFVSLDRRKLETLLNLSKLNTSPVDIVRLNAVNI